MGLSPFFDLENTLQGDQAFVNKKMTKKPITPDNKGEKFVICI